MTRLFFFTNIFSLSCNYGSFFSGNAIFFVKEILLEFYIPVDIELSIAVLPLDDSTNYRNKRKPVSKGQKSK